MNQLTASLGGVLAQVPNAQPEIAMETNGQFVVWRKGTQFPPSKFHKTRREAQVEARRLSRKVPGARFHVIQFCEKFWLLGVPRIDAKIEQEPIARRVGHLTSVSTPHLLDDAQLDALIAQLQVARAYPAQGCVA